jgi:hypothetical protein
MLINASMSNYMFYFIFVQCRGNNLSIIASILIFFSSYDCRSERYFVLYMFFLVCCTVSFCSKDVERMFVLA